MAEPGSSRRSPLAVYAVELSVGIVAGLGLFLLVLFMLQKIFPDASGLGDLARSRRTPDRGAIPLDTPAEGTTLAVLSEIHRDIRDKPSSSIVWTVSQRGAKLDDGDAVQSAEGSSATIRFDDHNTLELGEKSLIVLRRPRQSSSSRRGASVLFMDGFLRGRLNGTGADRLDLEVLAGGGMIRPHAKGNGPVDIALALDKDASALAVRTGDAEVVWNDHVTVVPAGHMVTFDPGHAPGIPVALPRSPVPESPPDGERFRSRAAPPRVSFSWRPVDDTSEFTLQVAHDSKFSQLVFDRTQSETSFTHGALAAGDYYWRVIGRHGQIIGGESATSRFTIETAAHPPQLRVEVPSETTGSSVVIRGETEHGCRIIIGDVNVPTDEAGRFEYTLTLRDGYNFVVVQAVDALGNTAFESRKIVAGPGGSERKP